MTHEPEETTDGHKVGDVWHRCYEDEESEMVVIGIFNEYSLILRTADESEGPGGVYPLSVLRLAGWKRVE